MPDQQQPQSTCNGVNERARHTSMYKGQYLSALRVIKHKTHSWPVGAHSQVLEGKKGCFLDWRHNLHAQGKQGIALAEFGTHIMASTLAPLLSFGREGLLLFIPMLIFFLIWSYRREHYHGLCGSSCFTLLTKANVSKAQHMVTCDIKRPHPATPTRRQRHPS